MDNQDPNTLVLTAADSDAGGLQVFQFAPYTRPTGNFDSTNPALADSQPEVPFINVNPTTANDSRVYLDGSNGSTASGEFPWDAFPAVDSLDGPMGNFGVVWAGTPDFPGSIVSKAYGLNADLLPSTLDNTFIYELMYRTLFGEAQTEQITLGNFSIGFDTARMSDTTTGLFVTDNQDLQGTPLFDVSYPSGLNLEGCCVTLEQADLLLAPELAEVLGITEATGADVGDVRIDAKASLQNLTLTIDGGVTSVALDTALLEDVAGLALAGANGTVEPATKDFQVGFAITDATDLTLGLSGVSGSIEHAGSITFNVV